MNINSTSAISFAMSESEKNMQRLQFPWKLHCILDQSEKEGYSDIVSWMPSKRSFKILDKGGFVSTVMPRFFSSSSYKSFQRSLNLWGFKVVVKASVAGMTRGEIYHPCFVRGRQDLCNYMQRLRIRGSEQDNNIATAASSNPLLILPNHGGLGADACVDAPNPPRTNTASNITTTATQASELLRATTQEFPQHVISPASSVAGPRTSKREDSPFMNHNFIIADERALSDAVKSFRSLQNSNPTAILLHPACGAPGEAIIPLPSLSSEISGRSCGFTMTGHPGVICDGTGPFVHPNASPFIMEAVRSVLASAGVGEQHNQQSQSSAAGACLSSMASSRTALLKSMLIQNIIDSAALAGTLGNNNAGIGMQQQHPHQNASVTALFAREIRRAQDSAAATSAQEVIRLLSSSSVSPVPNL